MSNQPPDWPNGAPPPGDADPASPFRPLQAPPGAARPPMDPYRSGNPPYQSGGQPYPGRPTQTGPGQPYPGDSRGSTPLGPQPYAAVSIDDFAPRRDSRPMIVLAVVAALLAGAVVAGLLLASRLPASNVSASPTPTASRTPVSTRTANPNGQGVEFQSGTTSGYWEITKQTWQTDGVLLQLSVTVDHGSLSPLFYVFNNDTNDQYRVDLSQAPEPRFPATALSEGKSYTGQVLIKMPHVNGTLIMTQAGRQVDAISALPIKK